jgi:acetyl esterase/lipase
MGKKKAPTSRPATLPAAPEGVVIQRDVAYLPPGRKEKLDLYLPAGRPKAVRSPAVVIIHGGGWSGGDKSANREFNIGTTLAKAGYVCASVEYLKEGTGRWPTNLHDCKNAVRFLRANADQYQVDADHLGVIGGSAGGHLALMVAYTFGVKELTPDSPYPGTSDKVQCCVDLYGPTDLLTRQSTDPDGTPNGKLREAGLFPDRRGEIPEKWKLASPVYHVRKDSPPTLILHGTADTTVDRGQSVELDRKLSEAGVEHRLILLPGIGHTFDLQQWQGKPLPEDLRPVVVGFFDKHLKPAPPQTRRPPS